MIKCRCVTHTVNPDNIANLAAYICTKTEITDGLLDACVKENNDNVFFAPLMHALKSRHYSVLEHVSFTFYISGISRVTLDQLTRHRIAAYSVSSQRYTNIEDQTPVIPNTIVENWLHPHVKKHMEDSIALYKHLVDAGVPREDARYVMPEGTITSLLLTMNARELLHVFNMRCCNRAQWEIRQLADMMLEICKKEAPIIFENAGPSCVSEGVCHEARSCGKPRSINESD